MMQRGTRIGLAGALAVAALLMIAVFEPSSPPPAPESAEVAPRAVEAAPAPVPPADLDRAPAAVEVDWLGDGVTGAAAEPAARKPAYRGQLVVGAAYRPLACAPLRLTFAWLDTVLPVAGEETAEARQGEPPLLDWRGATEEHGYFTLPFVPQRRDLFLRIDPGGPADDVLMLRRATWEDETVDLGVIVLEERGAVRGRIRGANAARVRAVDLPLTNAWVGEDDRERALHGAALVHEHRLWLGARSITAIPRWVAQRDAALPFPETETDGAGQFALRAVRPGNVRLLVQARDGTALARDVRVEPGCTTEVELALPEVELARLRIIDADGDPAEVDVVVTDARSAEDVPIQAVVPPRRSANGEVWAAARALQDGTVLVRRKAYWPWESYHARRAGRGFAVELSRLGELSVRLHGIDGSTVRDARVQLLAPRMPLGASAPSLPSALQPREVEPALWRAAALPIGPYEVVVRAPGFAPAIDTLDVVAVEARLFDVHLFPSFAMAVRVLDASGRPLPGATVRALPHDRNPRLHGTRWSRLVEHPLRLGTTGDDGVLQVSGFWDNPFSFAAEHSDHGRGLATERAPRPGLVVDVRLQETGSLLGRLTERGAAPTETLLVRAQPSRELRERVDGNRHLDATTVRVDPEGLFTLRALWPGRWSVAVVRPHAEAGTALLRSEVWVHAGATEVLELALPEMPWEDADVRGRVQLAAGSPCELVAVLERTRADHDASSEQQLARWLGRNPRRQSLSPRDEQRLRASMAASMGQPFFALQPLDREGRFAFTGVPLLPLRLSIRRRQDGAAELLAVRAVPAERQDTLELEIPLALGSLRVQVLGPDGPCRHREIVAVLAGVERELALRAVADDSGTIALRDVAAGVYEVQLGDGPARLAGRCTVVAGEDGSVQVLLERG